MIGKNLGLKISWHISKEMEDNLSEKEPEQENEQTHQIDTHLLQEIVLRIAKHPEPLYSLPKRLDALARLSFSNRECRDIVFQIGLPALMKEHVPEGEMKAHSQAEIPTFENLAYMSDGMIFQLKNTWIPLPEVISQKTRNKIHDDIASGGTHQTRRWVAVQEFMDLVERMETRWDLIPLHREIHSRRYMSISRNDAMSEFLLSRADMMKLTGSYMRMQFNLDAVRDLALEIHGSKSAIDKKIAAAIAVQEQKKAAKVARVEIRRQRVKSILDDFEAEFDGDDAFNDDSQDWNQLLRRHGDLEDAVKAFETSSKKAVAQLAALKAFTLDLVVSRMRDVLVRRHGIDPWPKMIYAMPIPLDFYIHFQDSQNAYDSIVWYDSEDQGDIDFVRLASERWRTVLQRFAQEGLPSPDVRPVTPIQRRFIKNCGKYIQTGQDAHLDHAIEIARA